MTHHKLLVLEVNELPRRVLEQHVGAHPNGALAGLLASGSFTETFLDEALPRDSYPSQSWASFNTGIPWEKHQIFWYGDPKPSEFPLYWQAAAAAGRSVGFVGTLHSSPIAAQASDPNIRFAVGDPFGDEPDAVPPFLTPLQDLNLRMTRQAGRVTRMRPQVTDAANIVRFFRQGVAPRTFAGAALLAGRCFVGLSPRERLRVVPTMLFGDVFIERMKTDDPDLAVLFTNHVAGAMHRYWAASFPEDWAHPPHSEEWRDRYRDEIPFAMRVLDGLVGQLVTACGTERTIVITSSMGQKADHTIGSFHEEAVIRDPKKFLTACGVVSGFEVKGAMVPQLTVRFDDQADLAAASNAILRLFGRNAVTLMSNETTLTATYHLEVHDSQVLASAGLVDPSEFGMKIEQVDDNRSAQHQPEGVLLSSAPGCFDSDLVDAFEVAPAFLAALGVDPLDHHRTPTFRLT